MDYSDFIITQRDGLYSINIRDGEIPSKYATYSVGILRYNIKGHVIGDLSVYVESADTIAIIDGDLQIMPKQFPLSLPIKGSIYPQIKDIQMPNIAEVYYDNREINVDICPVSYDKNNHKIFLLSNIKIKINGMVEYSKEYYSTRNGILIILPEAFRYTISNYVQWKSMCGYKVFTAFTDSIYEYCEGIDRQEKIRNAIKEYYKSNDIGWVLLIGDVDSLPARWGYALTCGANIRDDEDSLYTDLYYADLDGNWDFDEDGVWGEVEDSVDLYADVFVGRIPADSVFQVKRVLDRIIEYEKYPSDYVNRAFFMGMVLWDSLYTPGGKLKEMIKEESLPDWMEFNHAYEFDNSGGLIEARDAIKEGYYIYNHAGHGWWTAIGLKDGYLRPADFDTLPNVNKGIWFSMGCWTGAFDREDCIGEHAVLSDSGGALCYIGNSRYGWGSPGNPGWGYSDIFDRRFFDYFYSDSLLRIGEVLYSMKSFYVPLARYGNLYRWHEYIINMFGDPTMIIHTHPLKSFTVDITDTVQVNSPLYIHINPYYENLPFIVGVNCNDSVLQYYNEKYIRVSPFWEEGDTVFITILGNGHYTVMDTVYVEGERNLSVGMNNDTLYLYGDTEGSSSLKCWSNSFEYSYNIPQIDSIYAVSLDLRNLTYYDSLLFVLWKGDTFILYDTFNIKRDYYSYLIVDTMYNIYDSLFVNVHFPNIVDNCFVLPYDLGIYEISKTDTSISFKAFINGNNPKFIIEWVYKGKENDSLFVLNLNGKEGIYEDFEDENDWYYGGLWHIDTKRKYNGNNSAYCGNSDYVYEINREDTLLSPLFVLPEYPVLKFAHWYEMPFLEEVVNNVFDCDGMYVEIGRDNVWEVIDFIGSGGALFGENKSIPDWFVSSYDLRNLKLFSPGDTVRLRFRFKSDAADVKEGWYIDDVSVSSQGLQIFNVYHKNEFCGLYYMEGDGIWIYADTVSIYDVLGRKIFYRSGGYPILWNYKLYNISSGVYFLYTNRGKVKLIIWR